MTAVLSQIAPAAAAMNMTMNLSRRALLSAIDFYDTTGVAGTTMTTSTTTSWMVDSLSTATTTTAATNTTERAPEWMYQLMNFRQRLFLQTIEPVILLLLGPAPEQGPMTQQQYFYNNNNNIHWHTNTEESHLTTHHHRRLGFLPSYVSNVKAFKETSMSFATLIMLFVTLSCVFLVFLSCFYHNQKTSPLFTAPRRHRLPKLVPPPLPVDGYFSWVKICFFISDEEIINRIGYDSLVFLRFHRLALRCIVKMSVFSFCVLLPLNFTGGGHANAQDLKEYVGTLFFTDFLRFTMANVMSGSPRLWIHCFAAYLLTGIVVRELLVEYETFNSIRHRYLLSSESHLRTVLVTNIPRHLRSAKKISNYFKHVYPNAVQSVFLCQNLIQLEQLLQKRTRVLAKLENELLLLCKTEKKKLYEQNSFLFLSCWPQKQQPFQTAGGGGGGCCCCCGCFNSPLARTLYERSLETFHQLCYGGNGNYSSNSDHHQYHYKQQNSAAAARFPCCCCGSGFVKSFLDASGGSQERLAKQYSKLEDLNVLIEQEQRRRRRVMRMLDRMEAGEGAHDIDYVLALPFVTTSTNNNNNPNTQSTSYQVDDPQQCKLLGIQQQRQQNQQNQEQQFSPRRHLQQQQHDYQSPHHLVNNSNITNNESPGSAARAAHRLLQGRQRPEPIPEGIESQETGTAGTFTSAATSIGSAAGGDHYHPPGTGGTTAPTTATTAITSTGTIVSAMTNNATMSSGSNDNNLPNNNNKEEEEEDDNNINKDVMMETDTITPRAKNQATASGGGMVTTTNTGGQLRSRSPAHVIQQQQYRVGFAEPVAKQSEADGSATGGGGASTTNVGGTSANAAAAPGTNTTIPKKNKAVRALAKARNALRRYGRLQNTDKSFLGRPIRSTAAVCRQQVHQSEGHIEDHINEVTDKAFVVMRTFTAATIAIQSMHSSKPGSMQVSTAPEPRDILWNNIYVSKGAFRTRSYLGEFLVLLLITFYVVPVAMISLLVSESALISSSPRLAQLDQASALFSAAIALVQPLCIVSIQQLLPPLFIMIGQAEGVPSFSEVQMRAFSRYFLFQVLNVFLVTTIAGSIFDTVAIIIESPESAFEMLGNSLPRLSSFFITFVTIKTFVSLGLELVRVVSLGQAAVRYILFPNATLRTKRSVIMGMRAIDDPGWFPFHKVLAQDMLVVVISVVFAVVAPLVLLPCVLFCSFSRIMWTHQHLYVYESVFESGGQFWPKIFRRFVFGLIIAQMTITGQFILKDARHEAYATIALMFLTYVFLRSTRARYDPTSSTLPLEVATVMDMTINQEEYDVQRWSSSSSGNYHPGVPVSHHNASGSNMAMNNNNNVSNNFANYAGSDGASSISANAAPGVAPYENGGPGRFIGRYDPFRKAYLQPALRAIPRARPEQPFPAAQLGREEGGGASPYSSSSSTAADGGALGMGAGGGIINADESGEGDDWQDSGATVRLKSMNQSDRRLVNRWWEDQMQRAGEQRFFRVLIGEECGTLTLSGGVNDVDIELMNDDDNPHQQHPDLFSSSTPSQHSFV